MNYALRYFIIDGDSIKRLPLEQLHRICEGVEAMPEYRGRGIKCIQLAVRLENHHLIAIETIQGLIYYYDPEGYLDFHFQKAQRRLNDKLCNQALLRKLSGNVIDASVTFASKRFQDTFTWVSDYAVIKRVERLLWGT